MINLLPPQKLANIRIARGNTTLRRYLELFIALLVIVIAALVSSYYFLSAQNANEQSVVDAEMSQVAKLEPVQKQAEQLSATINTIAGLSSRDVVFSNLLVQIGGLMPEGSVLTGLQFSTEDYDSPLVISAQIESEAKAAILLKNLQSSDLFESADIKTVSKNEEPEATAPPASDTATEPTDATAIPVPAAPTEVSPYKFTTVIEAYFAKGVVGGAQ